MKTILPILILLFTISIGYAELPPQGKLDSIKKSTPAPYDGFIMDEQQMKHFIAVDKERKLLGEKVLKLEDLSYVQEVRVDYYKKMYSDTSKELEKAEFRSTAKSILYFIGGATLTGFISYGLVRSLK